MKSFSDACHLTEPLQLVVEAVGEPDVGVRLLHQPFALVGRDLRADVPLEHRLVSRRHVYIQVVEGHAFWIDLESRLGTAGGGRPRKYGWLTREEPMRIGPYELHRSVGPGGSQTDEQPPDANPLVARSYGAGFWPDIGLEFLNGPSRSAVWPMNRVISLVGSASSCKFRLADPSVSLFHCSLVRTLAGLWVVDLLGGGGVEVNNAAVRHALLAEGDVLTIGRYRIRIQYRSQAAMIPSGAIQEGAKPGENPATPPSRVRNRGHVEPPVSTSMDLALKAASERREIQTVTVVPAELDTMRNSSDSVSVLVPLMNQFGAMQQQMMDQFQNAMGMLVEMFGSLQREQMDLIRQELDQLREVTREFQELKSELAEFTRERKAGQTPTSESTPAASPALGGSIDSSRPEAQEERGRPLKPQAPPTTDSLRPTAEGGPSQPDPVAAPTEDPAKVRPRLRPEAGDADVMLWLNQRIATLQEERESRWQKILKLLPGSS